jgi:arsenate reductase (thioredoxin)
MFMLGLQGSPRKKGNTQFLLKTFMNEAEEIGVRTQVIKVSEKNIVPCKGCGFCEKKGRCITQDDDMTREIYPLLREADVIVLASPVYFYNVTAQLKALIDRSQTLWSRKYKLNIEDPGGKMRRGFLLSLGATKGKNLFEGVKLTAKYFFDAVAASDEGSLTYWRIEHPKDMEKHPTIHEEVRNAVTGLVRPFLSRKTILFVCRENACRSQMAAAFTQYLEGDTIEALSAGSEPADEINSDMVKAMQEKGIDMLFRRTRSLNQALSESQPDVIISMGCQEKCPLIPGAKIQDWDLPDPAGKSMEFMRTVRDEIENRVKNLINSGSI